MAAAGATRVKTRRTFAEAWPILQEEVVNKIIRNLEKPPSNHQWYTAEESMRFYTLVYDVTISPPGPSGSEAGQLYDQYKETVEDYICSAVLPSLMGKKNEDLLQELLQRWKNHKIMTKWFSRFFEFLDRFYIRRKKLPSIIGTAHLAFYNLVYSEINDEVRDIIISLINAQREGEQIDQSMVEEIMDIYVEIGQNALMPYNSLMYYTKNFEDALVNATAIFYSRKALEWIPNKSYEDYMIKVEECLNQEEKRVSNYLRRLSKDKNVEEKGKKISNYLRSRSIDKILEVVQHELLGLHATKLEEKKQVHEADA